MAVVTALEFDDFAASGRTPGQAYCAHHRFGAAAHKAQHFDVAVVVEDEFADQVVVGGGCAKRHAFGNRGLYALHHCRVDVAQDQWPPRAAKVYKCLIVYIVQVAAFAALEKNRGALHTSEGPNGAVYAPWEVFLSGLEEFAAAGAGEGVGAWVVALIHGAKVVQGAGSISGQGRV